MVAGEKRSSVKHKAPFNLAHEHKDRLKKSTQEPSSGANTSSFCLFLHVWDHGEKIGHKHTTSRATK